MQNIQSRQFITQTLDPTPLGQTPPQINNGRTASALDRRPFGVENCPSLTQQEIVPVRDISHHPSVNAYNLIGLSARRLPAPNFNACTPPNILHATPTILTVRWLLCTTTPPSKTEGKRTPMYQDFGYVCPSLSHFKRHSTLYSSGEGAFGKVLVTRVAKKKRTNHPMDQPRAVFATKMFNKSSVRKDGRVS